MVKLKINKSKPKIATYPPNHKAGMKVPKGGSCCANCEYVNGNKCTNEYFIKWHGSDIIPAPIDSYCSDWWESDDDDDDETKEK